jgi:hypothetical protein
MDSKDFINLGDVLRAIEARLGVDDLDEMPDPICFVAQEMIYTLYGGQNIDDPKLVELSQRLSDEAKDNPNILYELSESNLRYWWSLVRKYEEYRIAEGWRECDKGQRND